ncbi:MAG: periplasmic heavy metal sensor [Pseudomonadota bacterium]|nr:periplasmic heavy metal sensor [Pseudomonadota bacterium]
MDRKMIWKSVAGAVLLGILVSGPAVAQDNTNGAPNSFGSYGMGPWMMRGFGGRGIGPGMMDGYGNYGMGPWMMGGYGRWGRQPWMMRGYGRFALLNTLGLSDAQGVRIRKILATERRQRCGVMNKMADDRDQLQQLLSQDQPDPKKVGDTYGRIAALRQQMIVAHIRVWNEIQAVLTQKQREQLQRWHRGGWMPGYRWHRGAFPWGPAGAGP